MSNPRYNKEEHHSDYWAQPLFSLKKLFIGAWFATYRCDDEDYETQVPKFVDSGYENEAYMALCQKYGRENVERKYKPISWRGNDPRWLLIVGIGYGGSENEGDNGPAQTDSCQFNNGQCNGSCSIWESYRARVEG
jgi:hypothetical protein